jgi:E3 ubiquitin-protein ligase RNF5
MASGFGESTSRPAQSPSFSSNNSGNTNNNDAGNFECNICFDLAQDPIVTLCGHLFCWPCLYKWLNMHSQSRECPVCKALVEEEKLVPLYGRGKTSTDPRSKSIPGINIPNRPAGQRPESSSAGPKSFSTSRVRLHGRVGWFGRVCTDGKCKVWEFHILCGFWWSHPISI